MSVNLLSVVQGRDGKVSSMRVGFLLALITVLGNWTYINVEKKDMIALPESAVALVVGLGGVKVAQGYVGAKTGTIPSIPTSAPASGSAA